MRGQLRTKARLIDSLKPAIRALETNIRRLERTGGNPLLISVRKRELVKMQEELSNLRSGGRSRTICIRHSGKAENQPLEIRHLAPLRRTGFCHTLNEVMVFLHKGRALHVCRCPSTLLARRSGTKRARGRKRFLFLAVFYCGRRGAHTLLGPCRLFLLSALPVDRRGLPRKIRQTRPAWVSASEH